MSVIGLGRKNWTQDEIFAVDSYCLGEAALIVLAQAGERYGPSQDLIRACINDESTEEDSKMITDGTKSEKEIIKRNRVFNAAVRLTSIGNDTQSGLVTWHIAMEKAYQSLLEECAMEDSK